MSQAAFPMAFKMHEIPMMLWDSSMDVYRGLWAFVDVNRSTFRFIGQVSILSVDNKKNKNKVQAITF